MEIETYISRDFIVLVAH